MITSISPSLEPSAIVVAAPYAPSGQIISGTSETALSIPPGPPPFPSYVWEIVEANIGFRIGMRVRAAATDATAGTTTWIEGVITAWDESNLTVAIDLVSGVGLHTAWAINVTGQPGLQGAKGDPGPTGAQGPAWGTGVPIDSPVFTGVPTSLYTPGQGTTHAADATLATTLFATTAVNAAKIDTVLSGNPTAPTPTVGDNDTSIATTAFVQTAVNGAKIDTALTGNPTAPTPPIGDNDTSIATTAFVTSSFAPIVSPVFAGSPKAPTASAADNSTSLATTAFVHTATVPLAPIASPSFSGTPSAPTPVAASNDGTIATTAYIFNALLSKAPLISPQFTGAPQAPTPGSGSFDSSIATTAFVKTVTAQLASLNSPAFLGAPTAPTQAQATYDSTLATTAFVKTNAAGYQPLSADLTSLSAASGAGVIYYRSGTGTWSPVDMGAGMTFDNGTLSSTVTGTGTGGIPEAPSTGTYFSRRNATWAADPIQADAPSDGANYVRFNATWSNITTALGAYAPINAPTFTGDARAVTAAPGDNDTSIATTAFVQNALGSYAPLASPGLTGVPTAPTPAAASNDGTIATTAFVKTTTAPLAPIAAPSFTGNARAVTPTAGDNSVSISTTAFVSTAIAGKADATAVAATYAPINAPTFTGDARAVTPTAGDNDTSIATTAFVAAAIVPLAPLASPTFTGTPKLTTTPASSDNSTALASTAFDKTALTTGGASIPNCGFLSFSSATLLKFAPFKGDLIKINGAIYSIPAAGITGLGNTGVFVEGVAAQNLAASTIYFVYAFNNAGTITADFCSTATPHATSTTAGNVGVEIKSGDDTRSLIGMCRTNAIAQFTDSNISRLVRSWFNRSQRDLSRSFTAVRTTTSTTFVELNPEIRCEAVTWADDVVTASILGYSYSSYGFTTTGIGWDGVLTDGNHASVNYGSNGGPIGVVENKALTEGYHYFTLMGSTTASGTSQFGNTSTFINLNARIG
jgi:hypothetical protein